jgi:hypothetical protein
MPPNNDKAPPMIVVCDFCSPKSDPRRGEYRPTSMSSLPQFTLGTGSQNKKAQVKTGLLRLEILLLAKNEVAIFCLWSTHFLIKNRKLFLPKDV